MTLHVDPNEHLPLRRSQQKVRAADVGSERRVVRDGIEQIAHGALVCPGCGLPLVIDAPLPAARELRCGFCDHAGPARRFLLPDVFDTLANEVYMVARVRPPSGHARRQPPSSL